MNAFEDQTLPCWVPSGIPPSHSNRYLVSRIEDMDWQPGVTKHIQQYYAFLIAADSAVAIDDALEIIWAKLCDAGAETNLHAVKRQCERAYAYVQGREVCVGGNFPILQKPKIPNFSLDALKDAVADVPEISRDFLHSCSSTWADNGADFLMAIFEPTEKAAVFPKFKTIRPNIVSVEHVTAAQLEGMLYFLSNPVDGLSHPNPRNGNKQSMRSQESVTRFEFAVLESDHEKDHPGVNSLWLRYLATLPLPIVSICTSGGKSIHALVRLGAVDKADWDLKRGNMVGELVLHGADPNALTAVRLTRLPFGTNRKTGQQQELLYLNPGANGAPIV